MTITSHDRTPMHASTRPLRAGSLRALREVRAERSANRTLRRELATYTTPAEIDDLLAGLRGHDTDTEEIRSILLGNRQVAQARLTA